MEHTGKNGQKVVFTLSTKNQCARGCAWVLDVFLGRNYLNCRHIQNPERHFGVEAIYRDFLVSTKYWQNWLKGPTSANSTHHFGPKKTKMLNFVKY